MFVICLAADLTAGAAGAAGLTGFGFAAGAAVTAGSARRDRLPIVVSAPPLVFVAAVTCAGLITERLDHAWISAGSVAIGVFLTLGTAAPWLFAGMAGAIAIAVVRVLPPRRPGRRPPSHSSPSNAGNQHASSGWAAEPR